MKQRIAVPTSAGLLCPHFGHCEEFTFIDVDTEKGEIVNVEATVAPEHTPGLLPTWLHERGANLIIAGGMGARAQELFAHNNVAVIIGAPSMSPVDVVKSHLSGFLSTGDNLCDH